MTTKKHSLSLLLHDIRSSENVGAILRTADAAGVSRVFFSGYTPLPIDQFGRENSKISKAALGAEKSVPWSYKRSPVSIVKACKSEGMEVVALEQTESSILVKSYRMRKPVLLIVGNEVEGVSRKLLAESDVTLELPMKGVKESLNVSVATGITLYKLLGL